MKEEAISLQKNKEIQKAVSRACRRIEKMIRKEPSSIVISCSDAEDSSGNISEIAAWLFHRRHDNGS